MSPSSKSPKAISRNSNPSGPPATRCLAPRATKKLSPGFTSVTCSPTVTEPSPCKISHSSSRCACCCRESSWPGSTLIILTVDFSLRVKRSKFPHGRTSFSYLERPSMPLSIKHKYAEGAPPPWCGAPSAKSVFLPYVIWPAYWYDFFNSYSTYKVTAGDLVGTRRAGKVHGSFAAFRAGLFFQGSAAGEAHRNRGTAVLVTFDMYAA